MNHVTRILQSIEHGDSKAAEELLPHVYGELRKLAAAKMAQEPTGQTLQPTALVHEAWLRLVGSADHQWNSRGPFFRRRRRGHEADPGRKRTPQGPSQTWRRASPRGPF